MKLLLLSCVILTGCHSAIIGGTNKPGNSLGERGDPRSNLSKAMRSMLEAKSYRARVESSTSSGTTSTTLVEFVAPDRFHLTREVTVPGHASTKQETIVIGNDTWMKMGETPWQKFPLSLGDLIKQFRDPKTLDEIAASEDVKLMGTEALDGSQTTVYKYTLGDPENKDFITTAKTWISVTDNLPRKTESDGDFNIGGKQIHSKSIVKYYDYGADIKIDKPL